MASATIFRCYGGSPRYKNGVPKAVVSALEAFPDDRRVRCEGVLTVHNLSLTAGGARAMIKAGVAPVIIRLLRAAMEPAIGEDTKEPVHEGPTSDGEHLDRDGETIAHETDRGFSG